MIVLAAVIAIVDMIGASIWWSSPEIRRSR